MILHSNSNPHEKIKSTHKGNYAIIKDSVKVHTSSFLADLKNNV